VEVECGPSTVVYQSTTGKGQSCLVFQPLIEHPPFKSPQGWRPATLAR